MDKNITGLTAEKVKGFNKLTADNADMFRAFFVNFYNAWDLEARETIVPISVKYCKDSMNGAYLKFTYRIYGRTDWTHVKSPTVWY